jgi:hypothetical protein
MKATFKLDGCHTLIIGADFPKASHDPNTVDLGIQYEPIWPGPLSGSIRPTVYPKPVPALTEHDSRDPERVFYGPHPCVHCGWMIVKEGNLEPGDHRGAEFDYPDGPIYPNTRWVPHVHRDVDRRQLEPRLTYGFSLKPSAARAVASMILSAATEART